ncbi:S1C family serine protease [Kitasatospora sp. NPDC052896]|uniref:S1C family serine protease n=1 Tax=Kitasatospora sp. NPDC052896 TaxID=3364061 RepID=UPI0037C6F7D2
MSDQYRTTADESGHLLPPTPAGAPTAQYIQDFSTPDAGAGYHSAPPPAPPLPPAPPGWGGGDPAGQPGPDGFVPGPGRRAARNGFLRGRLALVAAVAAVSALIGGVAGAAVSDAHRTTSAAATTLVTPVAAKSDGTADVAAIASTVSPSVVQIVVQTEDATDTGTGVILTANGQILTNFHVIAGAVDQGGSITVTYHDGSKTTAKVTGTDKSMDVAVITADNASGLAPAVLGDSDAMAVGDPVVAIGNPDGLTGTVTAGIISAKNRQVSVQVDETTTRGNGGFGFPSFPGFPGYGGGRSGGSGAGSGGSSADTATYSALQTDAALNPGNSGGPLLNANGQVIGINSAMYSGSGSSSSDSGQAGSVGLGFAIPINSVKQVLPKLQAGQSL